MAKNLNEIVNEMKNTCKLSQELVQQLSCILIKQFEK